MSRRRPPARPVETRGSVLLEVLVATILVGILIGPLVAGFGSALSQARNARARVGEEAAAAPDPVSESSWEWGPRVISGWWRPGPVLHLRLSSDGGGGQAPACSVGVWVDGWLVTEWPIEPVGPTGDPTDSADTAQMGPDLWAGSAHGELVVRVRGGGGVWGPPWRLTVPEAAAADPASGAPQPASSAEVDVVVHRSSTGRSPLAASWSPVALTPPLLSDRFVLATGVQGWGGAALDGRSQWWWMESGRSVDLFF